MSKENILQKGLRIAVLTAALGGPVGCAATQEQKVRGITLYGQLEQADTATFGRVLDAAETAVVQPTTIGGTATATGVAVATGTPVATETATATPEAVKAGIVSLNYDETNGDPLTDGQKELVAKYLREAMAEGSTQQAMESAMVKIQEEADRVGATRMQGAKLELPRNHAWLVWDSNVETVTSFPTDISDVFAEVDGMPRASKGQVWVVVPFAKEVLPPTQNTFEVNAGELWAVAIH